MIWILEGRVQLWVVVVSSQCPEMTFSYCHGCGTQYDILAEQRDWVRSYEALKCGSAVWFINFNSSNKEGVQPAGRPVTQMPIEPEKMYAETVCSCSLHLRKLQCLRDSKRVSLFLVGHSSCAPPHHSQIRYTERHSTKTIHLKHPASTCFASALYCITHTMGWDIWWTPWGGYRATWYMV